MHNSPKGRNKKFGAIPNKSFLHVGVNKIREIQPARILYAGKIVLIN